MGSYFLKKVISVQFSNLVVFSLSLNIISIKSMYFCSNDLLNKEVLTTETVMWKSYLCAQHCMLSQRSQRSSQCIKDGKMLHILSNVVNFT